MEGTQSANVESMNFDTQLNPFLLHHSFGPTATLVTQQLLGASNYNSWSRAMSIALSGKNKLGFVDGSIKQPKTGNLLTAWKCNNDIVTSWIMNSVSEQIAASLVYTGSAKDIWEELKDRFQQSNGPRIYQLRKEFVTTSQVEVKIPAIKSQQVPQTPSPVEQISLKFRVQVKCRHFLVAEDNTVSSSMRQHKFRKLPFEILHIPIRVFKRDDEALQKFLSMQFETHYRESVDVKIVADAIKDKWIEITKENGSWSMFGSVFPLTITIKLWGIVTFHERELSVMTEIEDAMVPTSNSAIEEMVERAKFEGIEADNQSCVICLEKMRREEKSVIILKMPCLHLFHEDCIKKWLGKSHYCPICRFQMPTN